MGKVIEVNGPLSEHPKAMAVLEELAWKLIARTLAKRKLAEELEEAEERGIEWALENAEEHFANAE